MRNELIQVEQALKETTRLSFLFHKKTEIEKIALLLEDADQKINDELQALNSDLDSHKKRLNKEKKEYRELEGELDEIQDNLRDTKENLKAAKYENEKLSDKNNALLERVDGLEKELKDERTQTALRDEQTALRDKLVSTLISTENTNPGLAEFEKVLHGDFLAFASKESSLANEAEALLKLQNIVAELKIMSGFPKFHTAKIIAVAGGFSAGKSEFISSLFDDNVVKLPSDIKPTTAIPTYVISSDDKPINQLIGINNNNSMVDLLKIDSGLTEKLNHEFIQSFNFPLKKIMPYMLLTTKMKYKHICFIDTPGYNPSSSKDSHTADDKETAQEFVANADALIWVIGGDANGTISAKDIGFLKKTWDNNKPLYVVLNKADLKPEADIKAILNEIKDQLIAAKLSYQGITAYISTERKELMNLKGKPKLSTFLERMDEATDKKTELLTQLYEVDRMYQYAILKEIKERKMLRNALDDIALDLNQANFARGQHAVYDQIDNITNRFNTKEQEQHLKELSEVISRLRNAIEETLGGNTSSMKRPVINPDEIKIETTNEEPDTLLGNETNFNQIRSSYISRMFGRPFK